ncbi:TonB-dependent siderophore receptor [Sphingopyxis sp. 2PD]|uniref:TonB-dependent receptor n=1 Tax=Sphingopyxis sp. 2PD TaxID=2502196 RepID=UPI0010F4E3F5|nr:TonB-dependent siderophore receptor [Sphingopyxis sp. 2PD]
MALIAAVSSGLAAPAAAAEGTADNAPGGDDIVVTGYVAEGLSDPRTPLPLVDTPNSATVVTDQLLAEQGRRTLRDALRNITGISFQAGEGNPPGGGDSFSIRGFAGRDDVYVDGLRDPGNYFRDPFNADRFEVTKGPASAIAGRGNIGGSLNIVSRQPLLENRYGAELSAGTDKYLRATVDGNFVLDEANGVALRINAVAHRNDEPGCDRAKSERWGVNPVLGVGLGGDTQATIGYFFLRQDDLPDMGIPNGRNRSLAGSGFEGVAAPVRRRNYYGYSTDYRDVETHIASLIVSHRFNESVAISNKLRWAQTDYAQSASSPRFVGNVTTLGPTTEAVGNRKFRDQRDELFVNQTQLELTLGGDSFRHNIVVGFEYADELTSNRRQLDADGPRFNLFNPTFLAAAPVAYNGTTARIDMDTKSLYLFDTVEIGDRFRIVGGLRHDWVDTRVRGIVDSGFTAPGFATDLSQRDSEFSGNAALVFKPSANSSIYFGWGTAFEPSGRAEVVQLAGGNNNAPVTAANFNVKPERSRSYELGGKLELPGGLLLSAALFEITKTNARTPGVNPGDPAVVLDGRQRIRGIELQAAGEILPGWDIFAGYTHLDGEVRNSNIPVQVGLPLDNTPPHSATLWTSFAVTPALRIGGGVQYNGKRRSDIPTSLTSGNITITAPAYTVVDAFVEYGLTDNVKLRANVYNIGDNYYFQSLGSGQSIPGPGRSGVLTLALDF